MLIYLGGVINSLNNNLSFMAQSGGENQENGWMQDFINRGKVSQHDSEILGGWIADSLIKGLTELGSWIFNTISPFLDYGSKIIIASCFLIYWNTGEKKYLATLMKWVIVYLIYCTIRGAIV